MPGNILNTDIMFPQFRERETTDQKVVKVMNYLYMLREQLRYSLCNLGIGNFNEGSLSELAGMITDPIYVHLEDVDGNIHDLHVTADALYSRIENAEGNISTLTQEADNLTARIEDAEGNISTLQQTSTSLTSRIEDAEGNISSLQQTATSLSSEISNLDGDYSRLSQTVNGISSTVSSHTGQISSLQQTASSLSSKVSDLDGDYSQLSQTVSSISSTVSSHTGQISSINQDINGIYTSVSDLDGDVTEIRQTLNGLTLSASNGQNSSTLTLSANGTLLSSANIQIRGMVTFSDLEDPDSGTVINGGLLETGTVIADDVRGERISIYAENDDLVGYIDTDISNNGDYKMRIRSYGGPLHLSSGDGVLHLEGDPDLTCECDTFYPIGVAPDLGSSRDGAWQQLTCYDEVNVISDARLKNSIESIPDAYVALAYDLQPCRYRLNNGRSGRFHVGFVAQELKAAMDRSGVDSTDFGAWVRDTTRAGEEIQSIRYGEFIGLHHEMLRRQYTEIQALERRIQALEATT